MNQAIIDLGSNTFHLLIFDKNGIVYTTSKAAKLGAGGIENNQITPEAFERGLNVLTEFKLKIDEFRCESVFAFGTSALRNAVNGNDFKQLILEKLTIDIQIISGMAEAELIYLGVKQAILISEPSLIIDIGGGSVEFIICNAEKALWQQSFEIGGLRLMEKFMPKETLSAAQISKLNDYLQQQLLPLTNAVHQYQPKTLIGSSGTFDTLNDMFYFKTQNTPSPETQNGFEYPLTEFWLMYEKLLFSTRAERLAIPGMIEMRVDMIVVALCLIKFVLEKYQIQEIKISNFALKEGAMSTLSCI